MRFNFLTRTLALLGLFFGVQFSAKAQNIAPKTDLQKIDSINRLLKIDKEDTNKIFHYLDLARYYSELGSLDTSILFANKALYNADVLLAKTSNSHVRKVIGFSKEDAFFRIGNVFKQKNDFESAEKSFESALHVAQEFKDNDGIVFFYGYIGYAYSLMNNNSEAIKYFKTCLTIADTVPTTPKSDIEKYSIRLGIAYADQGNYAEALNQYFAALKLCEETGEKSDMANIYGNIASLYEEQGKIELAIENVTKSMEIRRAIGDSSGLTTSYTVLGDIYFKDGKYELSLNNYQKSIDIAYAIGDTNKVGSVTLGIGNVYFAQNRYEDALKQFLLYRQLNEKSNNAENMSAAYGSVANVYIKQKKFREAETNIQKGLDLALGIGRKIYIRDFYLSYVQLDSAKGDFKGAFENHKRYVIYRDSLDNEEVRKKNMQSVMSYEFDKKEAVATAEHKKELESQKIIGDEKSRKQKIILGCVGGGLMLVILFAAYVFRSLRNTRKQKNEIEHQKILVEEKQRDILDSIHYAKKIQNSLMPNEKYIQKSLTRLMKD